METQPTDALQFLLAKLAVRNEEDVYRAVEAADLHKLEELREAYGEHVETYPLKLPPRQAKQYRPYLPNDQTLPSWALKGIPLDANSLSKSEGIWEASDAIHHHLLFCDSIVVDDLLGPLLSSEIAKQKTYGQATDKGALLSYVQFLLNMRPFLGSSLYLLPPAFYKQGALQKIRVQAFAQRLRGVFQDRELWANLDISEFVRAAPAAVKRQWDEGRITESDLLRDVIFDSALERIGLAYITAESAEGHISPNLFQYDVRLLSAGRAQSLLPGSVRLDDKANRFLSTLVDIKLPGFKGIDPTLVASIRNDSEAFASVRETMEDIAEEATRLPNDLWDREEEVRKIAHERLQDEIAKFETAMSNSKLKAYKKGTVSILSGSASAFMVFLLNPAAALAAALGGVVAAGMVNSLWEIFDRDPNLSAARCAAQSLYIALSAKEDDPDVGPVSST